MPKTHFIGVIKHCSLIMSRERHPIYRWFTGREFNNVCLVSHHETNQSIFVTSVVHTTHFYLFGVQTFNA